jgi:hypothetical protein
MKRALIAIVLVGAVAALVAATTLREVASARVLCPVIDVDGGIPAQAVNCGAGGYTSIVCTNEQGATNTVYVGGSVVTTANGYPLCSSCAGGSAMGIDTTQGEMYCTTGAASHDGGTPLSCLCGW